MTLEAVTEMKKSLMAAHEGGKAPAVCDILNQLYKITATEELLKKSSIGMVVGKLRNDKNPEISKLAKSVVHKWKKNVTEAASLAKKKLEAQKESASKSPIEDKDKDKKVVDNKPTTSSPAISAVSPKTDQKPATPKAVSSVQKARSFASDNAKFAQTNHKIRDKSIEMLYNSLCVDNDTDSKTLIEKAVEIELAEFKKYNDVTQAYKTEMRSFFLNLKDVKNPNLRLSVIENKILATDFVNMTPEDMASEERKRLDELIYKENLFKSQGAGPQEAETDMFRCGKCGQRKARYYQLQTRSADEPMTTFVTCTICNNRWKFC